jgi:trk system potassium uptake protein
MEFSSGRSRRRPHLTLHMIGLALCFVAVGMLVGAAVAVGDRGPHADALALAAFVTVIAGLASWAATTVPREVGAASVFAAVTATWVAVSFAGALPYVLAGTFPHLDDALFESVSGFTGTGSTVLADIEGAGAGILFWRSLTQWYGGMGVIVLAVAVLPFLGVGGLDLIRAEAPGPTSDRLAPRVSETAKRLWGVYGGLTVVAVAALLVCGLSPFDAVTHAFTVVSTGGFSTYGASISAFDSAAVEAVIIVLMLVAAVNFALHWRALRAGRRWWAVYASASELRLYVGMFVGFTAVVALLQAGAAPSGATAVREAAFNVATLLTSTGFGTADFVQWVPAVQLLLLVLMATGGMAGSTSGGIKLLRVQVMWQHAGRESRRARHPRAVLPVRQGGTAVGEDVVARVAGFVLAYVSLVLAGTLVVATLGADLPTSAGSVVSALSNMGPGLGDAGPASSFLVFTRPARAVLVALMLLGRLEIFSVLLAGVAATRFVRRRHDERRLSRSGGPASR